MRWNFKPAEKPTPACKCGKKGAVLWKGVWRINHRLVILKLKNACYCFEGCLLHRQWASFSGEFYMSNFFAAFSACLSLSFSLLWHFPRFSFQFSQPSHFPTPPIHPSFSPVSWQPATSKRRQIDRHVNYWHMCVRGSCHAHRHYPADPKKCRNLYMFARSTRPALMQSTSTPSASGTGVGFHHFLWAFSWGFNPGGKNT